MVITYKTVTSIFMVPTLKISREFLYENNFINAYLGDVDKEEYHQENVIFLLFKPKDLNQFSNFLDLQYENNEEIIDDYDYEKGYVVLVYLLNEKFKEDFELIKKGKYSKVSENFKNLFPKKVELLTHPNKPKKDSLQWMIFNKDQKLINYIEEMIDSTIISNHNLEVWPTFNEKNEILDIEKIINNEE
jgi:hypothetical protein